MWMKLFKICLILALIGLIIGVIGIGYGLWYFNKDLPDHEALQSYNPPTVTRVHAGDGKLIAEYAEQRRVYVPIDNIPKRIIQAFISAEDKDFYSHSGVDTFAIARAMVQNVSRLLKGQRPIGASTITQQVAKNFLLNNDRTLQRKIREALLALRIENALDKDTILDLYLNEIYLGKGAYGVASAALVYFDRSLSELSISEAAFLAALPKAPNNYNPWHKYDRAKARRDWVIKRMSINGFISADAAKAAQNTPLEPKAASGADSMDARYFVEHVRKELSQDFGSDAVNRGGLSVRTTLDTHLQQIADDVLSQGLIDYDRRHGYRGVVISLPEDAHENWLEKLPETKLSQSSWQYGLVLESQADFARIRLEDNNEGILPLAELKWARAFVSDRKRGAEITAASEVLRRGDVVIVASKETPTATDSPLPNVPHFSLQQNPEVNGGIVALDPFTGRILAMQGGIDFSRSEFNRSTQAKRQPGSAFKPFVYLAGLEAGMTPATRILDAPFVLDQGPNKPKWKPANYSKKFDGLAPMRIGIEKSRNLMTVRLAQQVGLDHIADVAKRFGITENMPRQLSVSLGAQETSLLAVTAAYGEIVNGGRDLTPTAIDRVQDRYGKVLFLHDQRQCQACTFDDPEQLPMLENSALQLAKPEHAYQITSMLQGVVQRGTGRSIAKVGYPLAGKTGTSNDSLDTWFVGFSPNLAVGVYVGFDNPRSLGRHPAGYQETGSSVAAPIFRDFMAKALKDSTKIPFRVPDNIQFIKVDAKTGQRASRSTEKWIEEAFVRGTSPETSANVIRDNQTPNNTTSQPVRNNQTLGLY